MDGLRKNGLEKRAVGDLHSKIKGKSCIKLVLKRRLVLCPWLIYIEV